MLNGERPTLHGRHYHVTPTTAGPEAVELMALRMTLGDPDEVGAAIRELVEFGIDGVTLILAANTHDPEMIALAGEVANAALG
jgi:alkanesulfonate monooxygenase SsuD/methylene tetrahydromethanopterin reductase-like flavin-dependent oxidoreductase (luciferase family)